MKDLNQKGMFQLTVRKVNMTTSIKMCVSIIYHVINTFELNL